MMAEMQPVGFFLDRYRHRSEQVRPNRIGPVDRHESFPGESIRQSDLIESMLESDEI